MEHNGRICGLACSGLYGCRYMATATPTPTTTAQPNIQWTKTEFILSIEMQSNGKSKYKTKFGVQQKLVPFHLSHVARPLASSPWFISYAVSLPFSAFGVYAMGRIDLTIFAHSFCWPSFGAHSDVTQKQCFCSPSPLRFGLFASDRKMFWSTSVCVCVCAFSRSPRVHADINSGWFLLLSIPCTPSSGSIEFQIYFSTDG